MTAERPVNYAPWREKLHSVEDKTELYWSFTLISTKMEENTYIVIYVFVQIYKSVFPTSLISPPS
jgi:hypothetical protein